MSIKFKSKVSELDIDGKIIQSKHRVKRHTDDVQTLIVKVVTKTAAHPYHPGNGGTISNLGYTIDGIEAPYLEFTPGITYRFDQSDSSNDGHPLRFYKDAAKATQYTTGVTNNDSSAVPGNANAYTQIVPTYSTPPVLHYQCSAHGYMGSCVKFGTQSATDLTGFDTDDLAESSTKKYLTQANLGQRSVGDLSDVNLTGVANNKILKYDSSTSKFIIADDGGSSSSAITVQEEGSSLSTAATTLNFVGSSVTASGTGTTKTITISGTGGSSGQVTTQKNISGDGTTQATDGSRTQFTISSTPVSENNLQIYIDGVYQSKSDFSVSGTTVTLDAAPATGAVLEIIHFTVIDANIFLQSHTTANNSTTSFSAGGVIANENDTQVYIDGVYQSKSNYSVSGSNVVLSTAPATGAVVEIVNIKASTTSSGSVTWETGIQTANFTAASGKGYFVNTTSNTVTVTLPSGSAGDEIHFTDYASTFDTNKIAFSQASGQKIQGRTTPAKNQTENAVVRLIYQDDTKGWTADNLTDDPPSFDIHYLIVAGGGGGAYGATGSGGGGGAGGYLTNFGGTAISLQPSTNVAITVGTGGAGKTNASGGGQGVNGTASSYGSSLSTAGGGGGGYDGSSQPGKDGGSGGGGGGNGGATNSSGSGNTPSTTPSQGNDGGLASPHVSTQWAGGGGGGIGAAGGNGAANDPGNGGGGTTNSITGASVTYAAGGGGGSWNSGTSNGAGGSSIGGNGGKGAANGTNGSAYTGSGGGGGQDGSGGNGADGVVILRYTGGTLSTTSGNLTTSHLNTTISGTTKYTRFTGGSGNIQIA